MKNGLKTIAAAAALCALMSACTKSESKPSPNVSGWPETPFTITSESQLIGGPNAQGRVGDVLLSNDRIRVVIQKPRKNSGVNSFGGNIIDADLVRASGAAGQDNFGSIFPLVNIEWTVNYLDYEAVSDGSGGGTKKLRAYGKIDAYDYLDLDFIGEVAQGVAGQAITFSNRFDDRRNPFEIYDDLSGMSFDVVTDYVLEPGKDYLRVETTFENEGDQEVRLPVGHIMNGSGLVSMLIPGIGFTPDLMTQVGGNTPAVIYEGFEGVGVSYGYFFDPSQFTDPDTGEILKSTTVSYSDVTGIMLGEEFLKLAPLGSGGTPEIKFSIPAGETRKVTSYFVVGDGSAGSVMDAGLAAIGASTRPFSAKVLDASGAAVEGATVAVMSGSGTLVTYRTDSHGRCGGNLPTGGDEISRRFGDGSYKVVVELPGYHANGTIEAGSCEPYEIDLSTNPAASVTCTLGETGRVELAGPVVEAVSKAAIPARLTIVGEDPSPNKVGGAGRFRSTYHWERPFGIVDVKYITANGTFDLSGASGFNLEPGTYLFVISRGPEYSAYEQVVEVSADGTVNLEGVALARVVQTPGYISADLHVHSHVSPDSMLFQRLRALSAAAEALDVLQSTDHDYITDYAPFVRDLMGEGAIPPGSMTTCAGDEVTPNHYGHFNVFPLEADPDDPEGGAVDWSGSTMDVVGPDPDYCLGLDELIPLMREDPGEEVVQVNHIMDNPTGLLLATGWVTSPFYMEDYGVQPLSTYADPVERRMPPRSDGVSFPVQFGTSQLVTTEFDSLELMVGMHLHDTSLLYRSALPTWFNLLNLGLIVTATSDSDSHRAIANPIGMPRNFIASSVDPADGMGSSHDAIDLEEYAENIREGRVIVSAGPFIQVNASGDSGEATVGDTIVGTSAAFDVTVQAPSWAWFDTIEVYANTEPIPVDDDTDMPMQGSASDPALFYKPYHVPRYTYSPAKSFKLSDGTLTDWSESEEGLISATVSFQLDVSEDTWVVVMARGTPETEGYRSLYPIVTDALVDREDGPEVFDPADLAPLHADANVGAPAWAIANPIFMDADGDGFVAKYVREGISPLGR